MGIDPFFAPAARVAYPLVKDAAAMAFEHTKTVNLWVIRLACHPLELGSPCHTHANPHTPPQRRVTFDDIPKNEELAPAFERLAAPFVVPSSIPIMWGPLLSRPEFLRDLDTRLVLKSKNVLYVASTHLGKTTAVLERFAHPHGATEGLSGIIYLPLREVQDAHVYGAFAVAVELDPTKGQKITSRLFSFSSVSHSLPPSCRLCPAQTRLHRAGHALVQVR
jgi:hypothetical protein